MVTCYRFGTPIETGAVVKKCIPEKELFPHKVEGETISFTFAVEEEDQVFGLGENVRGMNKRGWTYTNYAFDNPNHQEDTHSLYGAHNFFVLAGANYVGIFVDFPGEVTFDVGYTNRKELKVTVQGTDFDVYYIEAGSILKIVKEFRGLIGTSYIPPKWGFGLGQSRWSYPTEADVLEVARQYKECDFPLDSIYLDIDYMERYKDFTVSKDNFPDLKGLAERFAKEDLHLVPIIDAGVKIEKGYDVYEEGVEKGYFCKDADGKDFVTAVWPGRTHFLDVLNSEARAWFGDFYKRLLDLGIDGFWNDMNEPSIFYTERGLKSIMDAFDEIRGKENLDLDVWFAFLGKVGAVSHNPEDHKLFYHNMDGKLVRHDKVHNLFGTYMTKAAAEAFEKYEPDKRILMYSRSSYVGMHRYSGIWMGDNKSWWSHLLMNLQMLPGLNMVGILYTGADMGGFGSDTTEDLLMRWLAVSAFTPLMRNHSSKGTRFQEPYRFAEKDAIRGLIQARYKLIPYLYSEFVKCAKRDDMMFRPLCFDFPQDRIARNVEDQLFVGESIMIAPVYTQNATGRNVYLPEPMKLIRLGVNEDLVGVDLEVGWHYLEVPLTDILVFIRSGHLLPLGKAVDRVSKLSDEDIILLGQDGCSYEYYNDDGYTKEIDLEKSMKLLTKGR